MHTIVLIRPSFDAKIKSCCVYADGFHIRPPENPYHSYASSLSLGMKSRLRTFLVITLITPVGRATPSSSLNHWSNGLVTLTDQCMDSCKTQIENKE